MSGDGADLGQRVDVGTGPGVDLDLQIPASGTIIINFDWLIANRRPIAASAVTGVTAAAIPPHAVTGANDIVTVPWPCHNLILDNPNVVNSIIYTINEGLSAELFGEDTISFDKRQIWQLLIQGTPADRVVVHTW